MFSDEAYPLRYKHTAPAGLYILNFLNANCYT